MFGAKTLAEKPFFTVFVPTYNRGYIIERTLRSCEQSSFRDFEVVLVDDGSTDNTQEVLERLKPTLNYNLRCFQQKNGGKHTAHNHAVSVAEGFLFLTLDSDDELLPEALENLHRVWHGIPEDQRREFVSVEGLCYEEGKLTSSYPGDFVDSDYLRSRQLFKTKGEKRSAYRVEVLKEFPFTVFPGERYCRPGLIEMRMAHKYKTRFANIPLIKVGHEADGICANRRKVTIRAPLAYRQYFLEEIRDHYPFTPKKTLKSFYKRYSRHSFNSGYGIFVQYREVPNKWYWLAGLPDALAGSISDKVWKLRNERKSRAS